MFDFANYTIVNWTILAILIAVCLAIIIDIISKLLQKKVKTIKQPSRRLVGLSFKDTEVSVQVFSKIMKLLQKKEVVRDTISSHFDVFTEKEIANSLVRRFNPEKPKVTRKTRKGR